MQTTFSIILLSVILGTSLFLNIFFATVTMKNYINAIKYWQEKYDLLLKKYLDLEALIKKSNSNSGSVKSN